MGTLINKLFDFRMTRNQQFPNEIHDRVPFSSNSDDDSPFESICDLISISIELKFDVVYLDLSQRVKSECRDKWYYNKRFIVSICLLLIICLIFGIVGYLVGLTSSNTNIERSLFFEFD